MKKNLKINATFFPKTKTKNKTKTAENKINNKQKKYLRGINFRAPLDCA